MSDEQFSEVGTTLSCCNEERSLRTTDRPSLVRITATPEHRSEHPEVAATNGVVDATVDVGAVSDQGV